MAHAERLPRSTVGGSTPPSPPKKLSADAWQEARALIWAHRGRLGVGLAVMVINRLSGLVLPATTKYLMDDVVGKQNWALLPKLAMAAGAATLVDVVTSFANSQILG